MVDQLFWAHFALADLFYGQNRFDDARVRLECAESFAVEKRYPLAHRSRLHARFLYRQHMFEETKSEALYTLHAFEVLLLLEFVHFRILRYNCTSFCPSCLVSFVGLYLG